MSRVTCPNSEPCASTKAVAPSALWAKHQPQHAVRVVGEGRAPANRIDLRPLAQGSGVLAKARNHCTRRHQEGTRARSRDRCPLMAPMARACCGLRSPGHACKGCGWRATGPPIDPEACAAPHDVDHLLAVVHLFAIVDEQRHLQKTFVGHANCHEGLVGPVPPSLPAVESGRVFQTHAARADVKKPYHTLVWAAAQFDEFGVELGVAVGKHTTIGENRPLGPAVLKATLNDWEVCKIAIPF
mmetsp:Transcript_75415/g.191356  ORF Transcript_75415/g.191356 Transcript_75415/m.191356 type:complete len:242 (+) Transcript_75415:952-1677(+)